MATPDRARGPLPGRPIIYSNSGTIYGGTISTVNGDGTVNLVYFSPSGATYVGSSDYSAGLDQTAANYGKWSFPDVL